MPVQQENRPSRERDTESFFGHDNEQSWRIFFPRKLMHPTGN